MDYLILAFLFLSLPLLFWWQNRAGRHDMKTWFLRFLFVGVWVANFFLIAPWPLMPLGYFTRYLFPLLFAIISIKTYLEVQANKEPLLIVKRSIVWRVAGYAVYLFFLSLLSLEIAAAVKAGKTPSGSIDLAFPLKNGIYYVAHGGNDPTVNHHQVVRAQTYALDILQINQLGLRASKFFPSEPAHFEIFHSPLYSPCSGEIIQMRDGLPNLPLDQTDPDHAAGNYIAIRQENTENVIVLAHLSAGSIQVKEGDWVAEGALLGMIGNSGNTSEPHLHIHAVRFNKTGDFCFDAEPVPITFEHRFLTRNSLVERSS